MNDACFIPTVRYLLQIASNTGKWKTVAYWNDPEEARRTMANVPDVRVFDTWTRAPLRDGPEVQRRDPDLAARRVKRMSKKVP